MIPLTGGSPEPAQDPARLADVLQLDPSAIAADDALITDLSRGVPRVGMLEAMLSAWTCECRDAVTEPSSDLPDVTLSSIALAVREAFRKTRRGHA
jgi:hypothetical protein